MATTQFIALVVGRFGYLLRPCRTIVITMEPYERFLAWRACHELNLLLPEEVGSWPRSEQFELCSQVRRAAWSAAANIVEGSAKRGPREFRRYLDITLGSLAELAYALQFARDRGFLEAARYEYLSMKRTEAAKITWGLYSKVSGAQRRGREGEPGP